VPSREELRCPTCGAQQTWSDRCRRCKSDLRLLRSALEAYEHNRELCLYYLDADNPQAAFRHAQSCHELRPSSETHRLLALCYLLAEDWESALEQAASVEAANVE
jgi:hypothetical protein